MCLTVCSNVNCFEAMNKKEKKTSKWHHFLQGINSSKKKKSTTSTKTLDANDFNVFAKYIMLSLFSKSMSEKEARYPRVFC